MIKKLILTATIFIVSCGGGSGGSGSNTPPPPPDPALFHELVDNNRAQQAVRFLTQATFGPREDEIVALIDSTYADWIDQQMAVPQIRQLPLLDAAISDSGLDPLNQSSIEDAYRKELMRSDVWWDAALFGDDQLRQRVAFALSEIFVISTLSDTLFNDSRGVADYQDMLASHAFGNFRNLIEDVTLHPMMGEYLSMIRNEKADAVRNIRPDENYARELMQLFSIGLVMLNNDGSQQLDQFGDPIPTYNQDTIKNFARVFTGWMYGNAPVWYWFVQSAESEVIPMIAFPAFHDTGAKALLNGTILPANQTPEQDLSDALDNIFEHQNVGPFISEQLIMRLVTSNPSPAYIDRVASVFNDNGQGVRGDLSAVVRTILLDTEARDGAANSPESFGKLKEPLLKLSAVWRAFNVSGVPTIDNNMVEGPPVIRFYGSAFETGQRPFGSPSVFNFFRPEYAQTGPIVDGGYRSPEFQILSENLITATTNRLVFTAFTADQDSADAPENFNYLAGSGPIRVDLTEEKALASNTDDLIDRLDLLLMAGQLSDEARLLIANHIDTIPTTDADLRALRVYEAIFQITSSAEFSVQQ